MALLDGEGGGGGEAPLPNFVRRCVKLAAALKARMPADRGAPDIGDIVPTAVPPSTSSWSGPALYKAASTHNTCTPSCRMVFLNSTERGGRKS